jgi:DNA-binding NarL/FixJ family response regulator
MDAAHPAQDEPRTVVLIDDHAVVRAGLRRVLEELPGYEVTGEAGTLRDGLEKVEVKRPTLVIMDIGLPDGSGIDSLPQLLAKGHGCRVLILSMHDEPSYVEQAFAAGAHGYLLKDAAETELASAIATIVAGERYVYPPLGAKLAQAALDRANDPLTPRERDIARLLALGHTNQEVASQLFLSVRTVETHRSHLMGKLRLDSRADLVRWALKEGLLDDSPSS